ncbi:MAG: hypothetical protein ACOYEH_10715 [Caldicoprobacterales bacterium]
MYDYERCKGLFYHIDFHLPEGSEVLYAHIHIINDEENKKPMYYWTNAALPENRNVRVFSCTDEVMFLRPESIGNNVDPVRIFGHARLPVIPTLPDLDSTYPSNSNYSNEYFFQNSKDILSPWGAAAYNDGTLYFDRSTQPLRVRKMFCWGSHRGGRRWCEYLSVPGEQSHYIEIQAGLTPTQLNGIDIDANTEWSFTQAFGLTNFEDLEAPYNEDWCLARDYVAQIIENALGEKEMQEAHGRFESMTNLAVSEVLSMGAGWGALEKKRREKYGENAIPRGLEFPASSIGDEQLPWLALLETGVMPEQDVLDTPPSWMIDKKWLTLLEKSINQGGDNATARLHLGIMKYENFLFEEGIEEWKKSLEIDKNPWALRNLAIAEKRAGRLDSAIRYMEEALELENNSIDKAFTEEYFDLLIEAGMFEKLWTTYNTLPESRKNADRIITQAGYAAVELDHLDFVEALEDREFANIREGDNLLVDMWFKYATKREAEKRGVPYSEELYKEIRATKLPPKNFDFRMVDN